MPMEKFTQLALRLDWFEAISKDNQKMYFRENGEISTNLGPGESLV